jgi:EAL domain-containing protein (putative c-di-GMP-specific phosphodiesterase class I)
VDADDGATLMKNADTAMYHAKEKGRNNFQFFSPDMNVRAVERHELEVALRQALERSEFTLLYQPQVDLASGAVVGAEALIRWRHPERGLIAPGGFIGVAEETGLIEPIGRWVLREACAQARRWHAMGAGSMRVAVNISARQLLDPREFLRYVQQVLDETGLDPRNLELEMTESLLLQNVEDNVAMFRKLGRIGVHIAVDDFGTGYSSLAYLKQLPINNLKIDRTFVRDIESDPEDAAIITAIIALAHSLKLQVTAEGVESEGQLEALRRLGCDQYQGYLKSQPVTAAEYGQRFLGQPALAVVR